MSDRLLGTVCILVLIGFFAFIGLRITGKYQLCENYYTKMNILSCMASDVIMPPTKE